MENNKGLFKRMGYVSSVGVTASVLAISSCSTPDKPLYTIAPNGKSSEQIENDYNFCVKKAEDESERKIPERIAKKAGLGALLGAAIASGGSLLFFHELPLEVIGLGGLIGGIIGPLTADAEFRKIYGECMSKKNYKVGGLNVYTIGQPAEFKQQLSQEGNYSIGFVN